MGAMEHSRDLAEVRVGEGTIAENRLNKGLEQFLLAVHWGFGCPRLVVLVDHAPGQTLAAVEVLPPCLPQAGAQVLVVVNNTNLMTCRCLDRAVALGRIEANLLGLARSQVDA